MSSNQQPQVCDGIAREPIQSRSGTQSLACLWTLQFVAPLSSAIPLAKKVIPKLKPRDGSWLQSGFLAMAHCIGIRENQLVYRTSSDRCILTEARRAPTHTRNIQGNRGKEEQQGTDLSKILKQQKLLAAGMLQVFSKLENLSCDCAGN